MWCNLCGVSYVVRSMWFNLLQSMQSIAIDCNAMGGCNEAAATGGDEAATGRPQGGRGDSGAQATGGDEAATGRPQGGRGDRGAQFLKQK